MKTVKLRFATSATTTSPCTCDDHSDDHHVEYDDVDVDDNDQEGHKNFLVHMLYMYDKKGNYEILCIMKCPVKLLHIQI